MCGCLCWVYRGAPNWERQTSSLKKVQCPSRNRSPRFIGLSTRGLLPSGWEQNDNGESRIRPSECIIIDAIPQEALSLGHSCATHPGNGLLVFGPSVNLIDDLPTYVLGKRPLDSSNDDHPWAVPIIFHYSKVLRWIMSPLRS